MTPSQTAGRLAVAAGLVLFGGVAGWYGHSQRSVPGTVPTIAFYEDWRLTCPALGKKGDACTLTQDLVDQKTRSEIAHLTLTERKGAAVLRVTVPFDVLLPSGLGLSLDSGKVRVQAFHTCDLSGCLAEIPVDGSLRQELRRASQGRLLVANLDKKVITIPFSMRGFAAAEGAFASTQAKHHFWGG